MRWGKLLILLLAAWLAGCASMNRVEQYDYRFDDQSGKFPPIRLYINREQVMSPVHAGMANALYQEIRATGAFFGSGAFVETPWVLDIQLNWSSGNAGGSFIGAMASAATLGIVPSRHEQLYKAEVGVYENGRLLDQFIVEQASTMVLSVYNYAEAASGDAHARAMKSLALRIVEQLEKSEILPRALPRDERQDAGSIRT